jgi:hypothetical protein
MAWDKNAFNPTVMPDFSDTDWAGLSQRRLRILKEILPKVVGGTYHNFVADAKFKELSSGFNSTGAVQVQYKREQTKRDDLGNALSPADLHKPHLTTCGALPGYVGKSLGVRPDVAANRSTFKPKGSAPIPVGSLASSGTEGVRQAAMLYGAWRANGPLINAMRSTSGLGEGRPQPGDFYALCKPPDSGNWVEHVGIILRSSGDLWLTADSGQDKWPNQAVWVVQRKYDSAGDLLSGEAGTGLVRQMRLLCGWVDVDDYPFLQ